MFILSGNRLQRYFAFEMLSKKDIKINIFQSTHTHAVYLIYDMTITMIVLFYYIHFHNRYHTIPDESTFTVMDKPQISLALFIYCFIYTF